MKGESNFFIYLPDAYREDGVRLLSEHKKLQTEVAAKEV